MAHFNFSCHIVEVGPKVLDIFEEAIEIFSRPIEGHGAEASANEKAENAPGIQGEPRNRPPTADTPVAYHVDARVMSMIVDSLVEELELLDSYTLVVLNPRKNLLAGKPYKP